MNKKQHGGKREGAGRKSIAPSLRRITVSLPPEDVEWLREFGQGNVSKGIRQLIPRP